MVNILFRFSESPPVVYSNDKMRLIERLEDRGYYEIYKAEHADFGIVSFEKQCVEHIEDEYV